MVPPRRKKWTEAEERTLIDKYDELFSCGTLAKMRTREKKFKPIAYHVNSAHHARDPIAYPWHWTWKDVSTKVQNMRHQYLLVKQKIRRPVESAKSLGGEGAAEEFDWAEGLTHWSNFLRYKEVFGDVPIMCTSDGVNHSMVGLEEADHDEVFVGNRQAMETVGFGQTSHLGSGDVGTGLDRSDGCPLFMGFDYDDEEAERNYSGRDVIREEGDGSFVADRVDPNSSMLRRKAKPPKGLEKKSWAFISKHLVQLREIEARFEQRDRERERERLRRENLLMESGQERERKLEEREREKEEMESIREESRSQMIQEWDSLLKDSDEREKRRREEQLIEEREWEERLNRRRLEWRKRIDERLSQHRLEMEQIQTRILHEQQNLTSQLLGIISQWTSHPAELSNHANAGSHYLSPVMQNMHRMNGMLHGDTRVDEDNPDDEFIVDG